MAQMPKGSLWTMLTRKIELSSFASFFSFLFVSLNFSLFASNSKRVMLRKRGRI